VPERIVAEAGAANGDGSTDAEQKAAKKAA
jgi:hypothetical protein